MKIIFFDKVIFEGTEEECKAFKKDLLKMLAKLGDELEDTYPIKETDTYEAYFEALKTLNPFVYETLSYLKEIAGDYFIEFQFLRMSLAGVGMWVYDNLAPEKRRIYMLGHIWLIIAWGQKNQTIWKIEE